MGVSVDGKLIELEIVDLAFDGKAVAHLDGKVVFLRGGLPGETVLAEITRSRSRYSDGIVRQILKPSPCRVEAVCSHFRQCGGCTWQDLAYPDQLGFKKKQVVDCLKRIGKLEDVTVHDVVGSVELFYYRNKMEFSFHTVDPDHFHLGLHSRGRYDDIFDLKQCYLQSPECNEIVRWLREFVACKKISVYDVRQHTGYMRFLMIRQAKRQPHLLVNIVTNYGEIPARDELVRGLTAACPEVTTIVHNQNGKRANIATGEIESVLLGSGYIEEKMFSSIFRIRANSFFQTNSIQTETLYRTAFDVLNPDPRDRVLDLYCGTGSIGILIAPYVQQVVGVELVGEAVETARENAALNKITNITFEQSTVRDFLKNLPAGPDSFDIVIVDPPRAGLHPKALPRILKLKPKKILYISCNPATFARDARSLVNQGYRLPDVRPIDMFPHTMHIELVGVFYAD
ncbi:MAG: 23S rRNA (uracil(1939)-C(5))-methyltransferase RlmD [bacterium]